MRAIREEPLTGFGRAVSHILAIAIVMLLAVAPPAHAADTLVARGDDPNMVTDREGTTHVVWDVDHPGAADTVDYCRIARGSSTCADVKHLSPVCTDGTPALKQDIEAQQSHGDGPRVMVSPFGDVVITTHGNCPFDWRTASGNTLPWKNYAAVDQMIVFHSTDDGATFPDSKGGDFRALGARGSMTQRSPIDDRSTSLYDTADSRIVTVQTATGIDYQGAGGTATGIYVLGRMPPPPGNDPSFLQSRLSTVLTNAPPSLVQRGRGSFAVTYRGPDGVYLRTFDCAECLLGAISDQANWTPEQKLPAEDRQPWSNKLVSGPAGTFLFYHTTGNTSTSPDNSWWIRRLDGAVLGPRHAVTPPSDRLNDFGDLVEDTSTGRLIAALDVVPSDGTQPIHTDYTVSDDAGLTWTPLAKISDNPSDRPRSPLTPYLSVATGDAGFTGLLFQSASGSFSSIPSVNPIFSQQLPGSGAPPPGDGGGGGGGGGTQPPPILSVPPSQATINPTDACKVKQFGPLDIKAKACFEVNKTTGAVTAKGGVSVNGLELAGADVTFDPKLRTVRSSGPVTVAIGDTKLFKLPIDWKLPAGNTYTLPTLDIGDIGGKLSGFPVEGSADVKLIRGAVEIPLHVALPKVFGGVTGDVTLRGDNLTGIHLRDIHVKAKLAAIGPLAFSNIEFSYNPDDKKWAGGATLALPPKPPGPVLASNIGFTGGELEFVRNELTFPGEGIPLDTFNAVHLTRVRFSLDTKPDLKLSGGVTFTAGPKFGDYRVAEINGNFTFLFPDGRPAVLRADGDLSLLTIPVANAFLQYRTDGLINFGGSFGLDVFDVVSVKGTIDGWILPPKTFSVYGRARVCVGDLGCAGGEVAVSSKGIAGCASIAGADVGVGYEWGPSLLWTPAVIANLDIMYKGCSVSGYLVSAARAAQADGSRSATVKAGLPFTVFRVTGTSAPPHVTLVSPNGERIDAPVDRAVESKTGAVLHVAPKKLTLVIVNKPAAGTWRIEPATDSSPIASAGHADGLPAPQVSAKVTGRGRARVLTYRIKPIEGQKVRFEERGALGKAGASLGYATGPRGRLRFAPANGPTGKRSIIALVESFGTPRKQMKVASYTAPPPLRPAAPRGLRLKRQGTKLVLSWTRTAGLARYRLTVKLTDGRVLLLLPRGTATSAGVTGVAKAETASASLQGERADGTTGPRATAKLRR